MSYFGISGIRNPYSSFSSVYSANRIRTMSTRRQNSAPRTTRARYNNGIANSANAYSYGVSGIYNSLDRLNQAKNNALKLSDSAAALLNTGKSNLFAKKEVTAEDGTTQNRYDTDAIYDAAKDFVESYNDVISSADSTYNQTVQNSADSLSRITRSMSRSLDSIGITVAKDGKLSLDEKTFKEADMEKVKDLLGGSYTRTAASYASRMYSAANSAYVSQMSAASRSSLGSYGLYGGYGLYGNSLGSFGNYGSALLGSLFNGYF